MMVPARTSDRNPTKADTVRRSIRKSSEVPLPELGVEMSLRAKT